MNMIIRILSTATFIQVTIRKVFSLNKNAIRFRNKM